MKMKHILLALVCLAFAGSARAQTTIAVSSSHIQGVSGQLLPSGSICFQGTDQNNNAIAFQVSGGGAIVTTPFCTSVTNGAITTFSVPNPASTSPVNIRYHIQVRQGSRVVADFPGAYLCNASGACTTPYTFNFDNCLSSGACVANPLPITAGPTGPAGPPGLPCVGSVAVYSSGTTYALNNCVSYSGIVYISLINSNTGNTPPSSPSDWATGGGGGGGAVSSVFTRTGAVVAATNDYNFNQLAGSILCGQMPALTGGVSSSAGTCATSINLFGPTVFIPANFGVKADGVLCAAGPGGTTVTITSGSHSVSCSIANFTSADIGKAIFGSNGSGGQGASVPATACLPRGTISSITNATTVVASTTAICTPSGSTGLLYWGTNDDAAWNTLDAAYQVSPICSPVLVPAGFTLWTTAKFNVQSQNCENLTTGENEMDYAGAFIGQGPGTSIIMLAPDLPLDSGCTFGTSPQSSCFFSFRQAVLQNFGMTGGGVGTLATTPSTLHCIVGGGYGSQYWMVSLTNFAGGTPNTTGVCLNSGTRVGFFTNDAFGNVGGTSTDFDGANAYNYCMGYCFWGDNKTSNFYATSTIPFIDYGGEYGICTGTSCTALRAQNYIGFGSSLFTNSGTHMAASSAGISIEGSPVQLHGTSWDNSGCTGGTCNGMLIYNGANPILENTSAKGAGGGVDLNGFFCSSACSIIDHGGNTFSTTAAVTHLSVFGQASQTGTTLTSAKWSTPAGASAGQWGTSPSVGTCSGATVWEKCTITVGSSTIGSNPILTVTFPTPYIIAPISCTATQVGGTQSINTFVTGTLTATTAAFTYQTTPTAGNTLIVQVTCVNP